MIAALVMVALLVLLAATFGVVTRAAGVGPCAANTGRHTAQHFNRVGRHEASYIEQHRDDTIAYQPRHLAITTGAAA